MKAFNIQWDTEEHLDLPTEIEIPNSFINENGEYNIDEISDYLSDVTGFCHQGFTLTTDNM